MKVKICLVRHGETEANLARVIQGSTDTPLTSEGIRQLKRLAAVLHEHHFDHAYVSDLPRAVSSIQHLLTDRPLPLRYEMLPELRERSWGIYDGRPYAEIDGERKANPDFYPEGSENEDALEARVKRVIGLLREKHIGHNVLLVAHGGINRVLLGELQGLTRTGRKEIHQANACLNIIEIEFDDSGIRSFAVHKLNCTAHLLESLRAA